MEWPTITKAPDLAGQEPNLVDYESACRHFSWDVARAELDGLPEGRGLNIAYEAVDRHALSDLVRSVLHKLCFGTQKPITSGETPAPGTLGGRTKTGKFRFQQIGNPGEIGLSGQGVYLDAERGI